jgi:hypothetical protein
LTWKIANAVKFDIDPSIGAIAAEGKRNISPAITTTYLLTARNLGGDTQRQVTLEVWAPSAEVKPPPAPPIAPSCINGGNSDVPFPGGQYYIVTDDGRMLFRNSASTAPELGASADAGKLWTISRIDNDIVIDCPAGSPRNCHLWGDPKIPVNPAWTLKPIKLGTFTAYEMQFRTGLYLDYQSSNNGPDLGPEAPGANWRFCKP